MASPPPTTNLSGPNHNEETTQIPAPESAKEKLRARPHIPWMHLGKGAEEPVNAPPPSATTVAELTPAERATMRFGIKGNAVLTGGAGALALSSARALLEHGLSGLALLDLPSSFTDKDAHAALSQLRAGFPNATILTAGVDVTDSESMQSAAREMRASLGPLNILCCFAGVVSAVAAEDLAAEEWKKVIDVNTTGTWLATQAVAKHMISDALGGRIILISSISGHRVNYPQPQVAYNTSKSAILHMRASLAAEWGRHGIRVNSISPGYMDTVLNEGDALAPFREVWAARNPMGRMGVPAEVAGPLVMLCSEAGSYVNGADLVVDGGGVVF